MAGKKDTRPITQRMKGRTAALDAAIDAQSSPPPKAKADADTTRRKAGQTTDKNNY